MKIFTEKGFQEELARRRSADEEKAYVRMRFEMFEEKIDRLYAIVEDLRLSRAERKKE